MNYKIFSILIFFTYFQCSSMTLNTPSEFLDFKESKDILGNVYFSGIQVHTGRLVIARAVVSANMYQAIFIEPVSQKIAYTLTSNNIHAPAGEMYAKMLVHSWSLRK